MIHVALFAKPPIPGRTKSRLAAALGDEAAAGFARAALIDNLAVLQEAPVVASLWHPPESCAAAFGDLVPAEFAIWAQQGADLGERMSHAVDALLAGGAAVALVIGSDCVTHTPASLAAAAAAVEDNAVVLRPAADGGFTLIGSRSPFGKLLDDMVWGGPGALAQVVARCEALGRVVRLTDPTRDVDVVADLEPARAWVQRHRPDGAVARWFAERGE